jgi:hypothetical protein
VPSTEYFRRQAAIYLRLSLVSSNEVMARWFIKKAKEYQARADAMGADPEPLAADAMTADPESPPSEATDQAEGDPRRFASRS